MTYFGKINLGESTLFSKINLGETTYFSKINLGISTKKLIFAAVNIL